MNTANCGYVMWSFAGTNIWGVFPLGETLESDYTNCSFAGMNLSQCRFIRCKLHRICLLGTDVSSARFEKCMLDGESYRYLLRNGAKLTDCEVTL